MFELIRLHQIHKLFMSLITCSLHNFKSIYGWQDIVYERQGPLSSVYVYSFFQLTYQKFQIGFIKIWTLLCVLRNYWLYFFSRDVYTLYLHFSGFSHRNTSLIYYKKTALGLKILYTFQYSLIKLIWRRA